MRGTLLAICLVALAGCAQRVPLPTDSYYRLPVSTPMKANPSPILSGTLVVQRFQSAALHNDRSVLYSDAKHPFELKQHHYHHWADSPPRLLQDALIRYLRDARAAEIVLAPQATVTPDYTVSGTIHRFERIRNDDPRATRVAVDLELRLRNDTAGRIILVKDYRREVSVNDDTIAASVAALGASLDEIYAAFLGDVRERLHH